MMQRFLRNAPLLALILALLSMAIFIKVARELKEKETITFDQQLLLSMREPANRSNPIGPVWIEEIFRDITALGGITVLASLTFITVIFLLIIHKYFDAGYLLIATLTGQISLSAAKMLFGRPRPDLISHGALVTDASFPSGHSFLSVVVYLTLGLIAMRSLKTRSSKIYALSISLVIPVLVGISRIYLGVHWPTDVLAGWAAGLMWTLACWLLKLRTEKRTP